MELSIRMSKWFRREVADSLSKDTVRVWSRVRVLLARICWKSSSSFFRFWETCCSNTDQHAMVTLGDGCDCVSHDDSQIDDNDDDSSVTAAVPGAAGRHRPTNNRTTLGQRSFA